MATQSIAYVDELIRLTDATLRARLSLKRAKENGDPCMFLAHAELLAAAKALQEYMGPTEMARHV